MIEITASKLESLGICAFSAIGEVEHNSIVVYPLQRIGLMIDYDAGRSTNLSCILDMSVTMMSPISSPQSRAVSSFKYEFLVPKDKA